MADTNQGDTTGTGTDSLEIKQVDPNASRKAIMARHQALTQAEREIDNSTVPGAAALQGGYAQGEQATTEDGDTAGDGAVQSAREPVATEAAPVVDSAQQSTPAATPAAAAPETVTLKVFGKEVVESKATVDAAGGVEARQAQLAADVRFQQAEALARKAQDLLRIADDKRRQYETKLSDIHASGRPAAAPATPAASSNGNRPVTETTAATGEVDRGAIKNLVTELYAGDPDRAEKALADVLTMVKGATKDSGSTLSPKQIEELVQAKVDTDLAAREAFNAVEAQRLEVNELMATKYQSVLSDKDLRADCAHLYNAAIADPRNQGRPWVRIADEVATRVLGRAGQVVAPNADIQQEVNTRTNFKRRIPQPSQATDRVPATPSEPAYPTKASDVVNLLRAGRHQPPM